jgi:hypothetical protein
MPYLDEIIGNNQCGFRRNISDILIRQIVEKNGSNGTVDHLLADFDKSYGSVSSEVLYSILTKFGIPLELVRKIKTCIKYTCSKVGRGKNVIHLLF